MSSDDIFFLNTGNDVKVLQRCCPRCKGIMLLSFAKDQTIIKCNDCDFVEKYQGDRRKENKPIEFEDRRCNS